MIDEMTLLLFLLLCVYVCLVYKQAEVVPPHGQVVGGDLEGVPASTKVYHIMNR